jgi:sugar phosphate isomerase/epimerase
VARIAINQLTTKDLNFEQSLEVYQAAGFDAVGIWEATISDWSNAYRAWKASGMSCSSATSNHSVLLWSERMGVPVDLADRVAALGESIRRLAEFQPPCVVILTGPHDGKGRKTAQSLMVESIGRLASIARESGIRLAIEPMHPSIPGFSYVHELADTLHLIEALRDPDVGIMFDTYHLWDIDGIDAQIQEAADRIFAVQVSDWREPPRSWSDRVLPGDGLAPLATLIALIEDTGYRGWYELEIMSDDGTYQTRLPDSLWSMNPRALADTAYRKMRALLTAAGID